MPVAAAAVLLLAAPACMAVAQPQPTLCSRCCCTPGNWAHPMLAVLLLQTPQLRAPCRCCCSCCCRSRPLPHLALLLAHEDWPHQLRPAGAALLLRLAVSLVFRRLLHAIAHTAEGRQQRSTVNYCCLQERRACLPPLCCTAQGAVRIRRAAACTLSLSTAGECARLASTP
jgi:hypothetical protein